MKAVVAAGVNITRVEVDRDGKITIFPNSAVKIGDGEGQNEWDAA